MQYVYFILLVLLFIMALINTVMLITMLNVNKSKSQKHIDNKNTNTVKKTSASVSDNSYANMTISELKEIARKRKIKKYYVMKKDELIRLFSEK